LHSQHSVDEYLTATGECQPPHHPGIRGFVLVKADRKCGRKKDVILTTGHDELKWIARVVQDMPKPREGDGEGRPALYLGIIPWAPMPPGSSKLRTYRDRAMGRAGESSGLVKGFRYVVQTEEEGMMLKLPFIQAI